MLAEFKKIKGYNMIDTFTNVYQKSRQASLSRCHTDKMTHTFDVYIRIYNLPRKGNKVKNAAQKRISNVSC